jgi:hypothetical protein
MMSGFISAGEYGAGFHWRDIFNQPGNQWSLSGTACSNISDADDGRGHCVRFENAPFVKNVSYAYGQAIGNACDSQAEPQSGWHNPFT